MLVNSHGSLEFLRTETPSEIQMGKTIPTPIQHPLAPGILPHSALVYAGTGIGTVLPRVQGQPKRRGHILWRVAQNLDQHPFSSSLHLQLLAPTVCWGHKALPAIKESATAAWSL